MLLLALRWWVSYLFKLLALISYDVCSQAVTEGSSKDQLPNDNTIYALVIGINVYPASPEYTNLRAAVADADAIEEFLVDQLKVLPENIISLRDGEATRQGILDAFRTLETNTAATVDPCIIIYYAGHGASSPRPEEWEDWATDREWIEQLCPSDLGALVGGQVVQGLPDRVICGLLNSLAEKRGNNITLIMDCCHSAGMNRHKGPGKISRCISNPPPLTAEANSLVDLAMPGRFADPADASEANRALRVASGFGNKFDHSHVLLAACGRDQSAYETHDLSHGIFTAALLKFFKRDKLEEVTYNSLMRNLDVPPWQTPHCMGDNSDRPLFNRRGNRSDPSYLPCKWSRPPHGQVIFTLYAGEAQGIEDGQQFSIHEKIPFEGGNSSRPSIGTMHVVFRGSTSSRLEFLPGTRELRKVPQVFYAHPLSEVTLDTSTIYCEDRKLLDAIFPPGVSGEEMKYAEYPTQAALILTVEEDEVHIDQNDPALNDYMPTRFACNINRNETKRLRNIIRSWRHFTYHLHRRPQNSTNHAFPQVRMELHYLEPTRADYFSPEYKPIGENLLAQEPAHISVSDVDDVDADASVLGMTLYNDGPEPIYPYLFYFDPNDLTITPWVMPAVGAGRGPVDASLLSGSKFTLGYGNGGATPWEFVFMDDRPKDIGFFKLYLSSSPANFACLTRRKTPFEYDPEGHRLGEELDKEVKEATALETALDGDTERWGVKLATVIQIRK
ncbi:hypothetical protein EST38_g8865 [Candolleomyces aberdarensis]|uniref:Peptidase C14 caspase domain-containing protein n=1 Tax=Candolleomyces aberdarensis TaxID=2316362 RepID=A0A4Q2DBE7_9AGAR|nr:hypothetical protein EST38_g8865 [Candolleomyces aberdarensis]